MGRDKAEGLKGQSVLDRIKKGTSKSVADWGGVNADTLRDLAAVLSKRGGAVRYGYTRDGGAYAIGIYMGGEHETLYVRPGEDIDGYLASLVEDLRDV